MPKNGISQEEFSIYADELKLYCKTSFALSADNLKDSLPSGNYIFYNVSKENRNSKHKEIILRGSYVNGVKDGLFEYKLYSNSKKAKVKLISFQHVRYVNGLKSGVDELYEVDDCSTQIPRHYYDYSKGKKNGICIDYENGLIKLILLYRDDIVIERFLGDSINPKLVDGIPDGR